MGLIHRLADRAYNHGVWKGCGWGIAAMMFIDGLGYLVLGNRLAAGPSFHLLIQAPCGMHSVGLVMLVSSIALFATIRHRDKFAQCALFAAFTLGVVLMCYTVGGWIAAHNVALSAVTKWFVLAWVALWLSATTTRPPGGPSRGPS